MSVNQGPPAPPQAPFVPGNFPTLNADHVRVNVHSMNFVISFGQLRAVPQPDGSTSNVFIEIGRFSLSPLTLVYLIRSLVANIGWYHGMFGQLPDPDAVNTPEKYKASAESLEKALAVLTKAGKK